jgi:hypothetical protein
VDVVDLPVAALLDQADHDGLRRARSSEDTGEDRAVVVDRDRALALLLLVLEEAEAGRPPLALAPVRQHPGVHGGAHEGLLL